MRIENRKYISAECTWSFSVAWSSVESKEEWGKEAHDRHASPSVRTCFFFFFFFFLFFFLPLFLLLFLLLFDVRRSMERFRDAGENGRDKTDEEEEPDIRRGAQNRTRKRERRREDWCATEPGNAELNRAGYRCIGRWLSGIRARSTLEEFCPLLLFFLSPLRSRSLTRPPLVA